MLKLSRKVGESVVIANSIYCTVEAYSEDEVCLIFHAHRSLPINRYEVERRIQMAKKSNMIKEEHISTNETVLDRLTRTPNRTDS
jgi:carbon storage regulator